MSLPPFRKEDVSSIDELAVRMLYWKVLFGWNKRNIDEFVSPFAEASEFIGFDGSQMIGRGEIISTLWQIFNDHVTASYVSKIKSVRLLSPDVAILRAVAGMVPPGESDLNPAVNAHQTLVATKYGGIWRIEFFQNTPAQFHGKPERVQQMTEELRRELQQLQQLL